VETLSLRVDREIMSVIEELISLKLAKSKSEAPAC